MEQIILRNIRVQLLSEEVVRVEYGRNGKFCDENTLFILNRSRYKAAKVAYTEKDLSLIHI